jgi:acetoin utilization protein AcuB
MHQTISHYMTRDPRVIGPGESLRRAAQVMRAAKIRNLPVVDDGVLVGLLGERDVALAEASGRDVDALTVSEAMTVEPLIVPSDAPLTSVARLMAERKSSSAVVVEEGRLVGVFSVIDALRALADLFTDPLTAPTCDRWGSILSREP